MGIKSYTKGRGLLIQELNNQNKLPKAVARELDEYNKYSQELTKEWQEDISVLREMTFILLVSMLKDSEKVSDDIRNVIQEVISYYNKLKEEDFKKKPIEEIILIRKGEESTRTRVINMFKYIKIKTGADLEIYSKQDLLKQRNFGNSCVALIQDSLAEYGKALWESR